jgi:hypothetical protein
MKEKMAFYNRLTAYENGGVAKEEMAYQYRHQ